MRATLAEVLDLTAKAFERWRYHHEQRGEPSLGEMQRAFSSLAAPLNAAASQMICFTAWLVSPNFLAGLGLGVRIWQKGRLVSQGR
jgi:hypothetical protein